MRSPDDTGARLRVILARIAELRRASQTGSYPRPILTPSSTPKELRK